MEMHSRTLQSGRRVGNEMRSVGRHVRLICEVEDLREASLSSSMSTMSAYSQLTIACS